MKINCFFVLVILLKLAVAAFAGYTAFIVCQSYSFPPWVSYLIAISASVIIFVLEIVKPIAVGKLSLFFLVIVGIGIILFSAYISEIDQKGLTKLAILGVGVTILALAYSIHQQIDAGGIQTSLNQIRDELRTLKRPVNIPKSKKRTLKRKSKI
jgi:uncharacterized membrane protein YkvI